MNNRGMTLLSGAIALSLGALATPIGLSGIGSHQASINPDRGVIYQQYAQEEEHHEVKEKVDAQGKPLDAIPFHPYYTVKDVVSIGAFLVIFAAVLFFAPTLGGLFLEPANFEPANPLSTPEHIVPVWYFTPYYAILRAVPDQRLGALLMVLAIGSFLFLPWLDRSAVRSIRYKGWSSRVALAVFAIAFVGLGYLGLQPAEGKYVVLARLLAVVYFAFFWLMPFYSKFESVRALPERLR